MKAGLAPQIFLVTLLAGGPNREQKKIVECFREENRILKEPHAGRLQSWLSFSLVPDVAYPMRWSALSMIRRMRSRFSSTFSSSRRCPTYFSHHTDGRLMELAYAYEQASEHRRAPERFTELTR